MYIITWIKFPTWSLQYRSTILGWPWKGLCVYEMLLIFKIVCPIGITFFHLFLAFYWLTVSYRFNLVRRSLWQQYFRCCSCFCIYVHISVKATFSPTVSPSCIVCLHPPPPSLLPTCEWTCIVNNSMYLSLSLNISIFLMIFKCSGSPRIITSPGSVFISRRIRFLILPFVQNLFQMRWIHSSVKLT